MTLYAVAPEGSAGSAGNDAAQVVVEVSGVSKRFRTGSREIPALRSVSLRMRRGQILGLVGPDGAGKTTLMRLVAGLLAPDSGSITVLGHDALRDPLRIQTLLGYMPQRFGLYDDLTVQENLDLYADLQGVPGSARAERYARLTRMTGMGPFTRRLAGRLSGGMKQKLGLACALVRSPELLVLDEPTVGVDPVSRRELWGIVDELVRTENTSVLLSTAYLDEADRCAEVVLLHEGQVLTQERPGALSGRMRGRTYALSVPGADLRTVQDALMREQSVADALIQGTKVRLVTRSAEPPGMGGLPAGAFVESVPPRLEDAFVSLLGERNGASSRGARGDTGSNARGETAPSRNGEVVI
ncbi:MAG: ABC transporter ATP-binding protein, partial [Pseudomonadota bacterium]